jgi:hypothetical protein
LLHEQSPFLEQITEPIRRFDLVTDGVSKRLLDNFIGEVCALGSPFQTRLLSGVTVPSATIPKSGKLARIVSAI